MYSRIDLINILRDDSINEELFNLADETRAKYVGNDVHLRGLIEFSNICKCHCNYCGLRCENKNIERYSLSLDEILFSANTAIELGYKTIVLQSGESSALTKEFVCNVVKEIKKHDIALTLSLGERSFDDYKAFRDAGADRYLLRIETTDKMLYEKMHPYASFENRIQCLKNLKELGFETGTGCLVGLPNQSIESLSDDILFFKDIGADMIGIGPFIPHPDTPLKSEKNGDFWLALKVMALTRIMLKDINIPATTAMETLYPQGRLVALKSGANVVMPNVTMFEYRRKYEIYPNKAGMFENSANQKIEIEEKIKSIGRSISNSKGFRNS